MEPQRQRAVVRQVRRCIGEKRRGLRPARQVPDSAWPLIECSAAERKRIRASTNPEMQRTRQVFIAGFPCERFSKLRGRETCMFRSVHSLQTRGTPYGSAQSRKFSRAGTIHRGACSRQEMPGVKGVRPWVDARNVAMNMRKPSRSAWREAFMSSTASNAPFTGWPRAVLIVVAG